MLSPILDHLVSESEKKTSPLCRDLHAGHPGTAQFFPGIEWLYTYATRTGRKPVELAHAHQYITVRARSWRSFPSIVYDVHEAKRRFTGNRKEKSGSPSSITKFATNISAHSTFPMQRFCRLLVLICTPISALLLQLVLLQQTLFCESHCCQYENSCCKMASYLKFWSSYRASGPIGVLDLEISKNYISKTRIWI